MIEGNITILVSHRIDLACEVVDSPLFLPMRCGAVYDHRAGVTMAGDHSGEHISEKRMSYCEFTVQYWAWKNLEAEYYGLCHYRRFLSFAEQPLRPRNCYGMGIVPVLSKSAQQRLGLLNPEAMAAEIRRYDAIVGEGCPVWDIIPPRGPRFTTVKEAWDINEGDFFAPGTTNLLLEVLEEMAPEYGETARRYFATDRHYGFNCYIMKRELFHRLCRFQFPIMAELEKRLPPEYPRAVGFMGEMLYGIFIYKLMEEGTWKIQERQIAYVDSSQRLRFPLQEWCLTTCSYFRWSIRRIATFFLPLGSKRRAWVRKIFRAIFRRHT